MLTHIAPGICQIPLRTPTLPPSTHTHCYLLGTQTRILIDPATPYPEEQEALFLMMQQLQEQGVRFTEVWLTHHHPDHIGAVDAVCETFHLPLACHPKTEEKLFLRTKVSRHIADNELLQPDPSEPHVWQALFTPGHACGHLCFYREQDRILISGDNVLGEGSVLIAPPEGHMKTYLASLERLNALAIDMLLPAHGPVVYDGAQKIKAYIRHRMAREEAVLRVLQQAPCTLETLTAAVYPHLEPQVLALASLSIQAHLIKLEEEHKAVHTHPYWSLA